MARQTIEFDNWIAGDTGRRSPLTYHYGRRKLLASYGHWRGLNVVRYLNGSIGPRPPMTALNIPLYGANPGWNGTLLWAGWVASVKTVVIIMTNGDIFYSVDYSFIGQQLWLYGGRLTFVPSCAVVNGPVVTIGCATATGFGTTPTTAPAAYFRPSNNTITYISGMPTCNVMVAYNQFIVVGQKAPVYQSLFGSSAVYFSDLPANLYDVPGTRWTTSTGNGLGVIGVGSLDNITGLFTQKDTLVVPKQGGEWWTVTGIPTGPPTIRRMDVGLDYQGVGAAVRQSNIWYPNGRDMGVFSGSRIDVVDAPDLLDLGQTSAYTYGTFTNMAGLAQADEFIMGASGLSYIGQKIPWVMIHHGMSGVGTAPGWSRHVLPYQATSFVAGTPYPLYVGDGVIWMLMQAQPNYSVDVFQFDIRQEIPYQRMNGNQGASFPAGNPAALYADMGTANVVNGFFSLPEWWAPDGHNCHITGVMVDLDFDAAAWQNAINAGVSPSTVVGFSVTVDALNLSGQDSIRSSLPINWGPPNIPRPVPKSNTNMLRTRAQFRVGEQGASSGFRVNLSNMRGVQIYRILATVDVDESPAM